ncbi:hypothetical protein RIdsm_05293 [Roseovarius indicus]|uniref:Bacterial lipoprotein (DUF940) n=2 Tax=Roseovarius indicus TaxID=540747 RepID=A0A5P3ALY6_9RHOB|nr:hypothetical protein RIdsm_05293 [Roseovarius indicus]SFD74287.1 Exopolysaccharide biosynthesis protein YbjH [Roseovarius indicus]
MLGKLRVIRKHLISATMFAAFLVPGAALSDSLTTTQTNNYGVPSGLIDMPTAEMAPDAEFSITVSHFPGYTKNTATFQILPWLTGSFRYSGVDGLSPAFKIYYDRSFDVRIRLLEETDYLPAIAVGLQDFLGTGVLSSEYIVATKQINNRLRVTGGIGWGRLGSYNSFASWRNRAPFSFAGVGTGGNFRFSDYFSGRMAFFGGLSYDITDKISVSAEYSSDAYEFEEQQTRNPAAGISFNHKSPWNFGVSYRPAEGVNMRLYTLAGSEIGASVSLSLNVRKPATPSAEKAPLPVAVRDPASINDLGWTVDKAVQERTYNDFTTLLAQEQIDLVGLDITERTAHALIENDIYVADAQALGRTFRVLSRTMPASVEMFHITVTRNGMPLSTTTFRRSDLERLENAPAREALSAAVITDSLQFGDVPGPLPGLYPKLEWKIAPFMRTYTFDPDKPFRADLRLRARADWHLGKGWIVSGSTSVKILGNLDKVTRRSNSIMPHVRSNSALYNPKVGPTIDQLTIAKYSRHGPNVYSRITAGYLEMMYAGVSGEVLWKPVDSRLALGAEVNFVHPRDYDQLFGLRTRQTPGGVIPRWNGHVSAYYDFQNGFDATVHAGRYLAGDWGATLEVARSFSNGWRFGAFATKTNVSAATFGEGSFDKGIFFSIPVTWLIGQPTRQTFSDTIRPLQRDGGQRLGVDGRLYGVVNDAHRPSVAESWGKFWR